MPGLILPRFGYCKILYLLKKLVNILDSGIYFAEYGFTGARRVSAHDTGSVRNRTVVIYHCCNKKWPFYQHDIVSRKHKKNVQ